LHGSCPAEQLLHSVRLAAMPVWIVLRLRTLHRSSALGMSTGSLR
jgi:hypothetical protein